MTSVLSYKSQTAPLKRYIADLSANIFDISGANPVSVAAGSILIDMGKTVILSSALPIPTLLRKVQVVDLTSGQGKTGYIYLEQNGINTTVNNRQNIYAMN